jgi:15-cis-phytoene synthase
MNLSAKEIAKKSNSSFYYAFNLLPAAKRDAMNTVYAFCRKTDDIVDEGNGTDDLILNNLNEWELEFQKSLNGKSDHPLLSELNNIISRFNIPAKHFFDLIKGMKMDVEKKRFESFEELKEYCYNAASTVGLMSLEIFGYKNKSSIDYAVNLGIALQLTNIIRDVKNDLSRGRVYLPQEDLRKFNYSEEELFASAYNNNFIEVMKFQAERAKSFFAKADSFLHPEDRSSLFAARAMQKIYFKLLNKITDSKFNIFENNFKVTKLEKLTISLGTWAKYKMISS